MAEDIDKLIEQLDDKCQRLICMVFSETGVSTEDPRIDEFSDDRGEDTDTINLCIESGLIKQVGSADDGENFRLVPGWWPHLFPPKWREFVLCVLQQSSDIRSLRSRVSELEAARDAAVVDGWQLVPKEPTQEMIDGGVKAGVAASPEPWCPAAYAAMLAAAPTAPAGACDLSRFLADQEPLGAEFEAVWDANVDRLYEPSTPGPAAPAAVAGGDADVDEWVNKRAELLAWTGSAVLSGEVPFTSEIRGDLYGFLCSLIGYLHAGEELQRERPAATLSLSESVPTARHDVVEEVADVVGTAMYASDDEIIASGAEDREQFIARAVLSSPPVLSLRSSLFDLVEAVEASIDPKETCSALWSRVDDSRSILSRFQSVGSEKRDHADSTSAEAVEKVTHPE